MIARLALIVIVAFAGPASADPFLETLSGTWHGSGSVLLASMGRAAREEKVQCRVANTLERDGREIQVRGTCSVAGLVLPVDMALVAQGGAAYSSIRVNSLGRLSKPAIAGRASGSSLLLTLTGRDVLANRDVDARIAIRKRGPDAFDLTVRRRDRDSSAMVEIGTLRFRSR